MDSNGDFTGAFFEESYKFLKPLSQSVIDIGVNIGDSASYFAVNDA